MEGRKMTKYFTLAQHLANLEESPWDADFAEIEAILRASLPESARRYPAWWSNQSGEGHTQSNAWQAAGWRTTKLDLANERVTFVREGDSMPKASSLGLAEDEGGQRGLTIQEAKAGLAAYFGVSPDSVEITIKG